MKNKQHYQLPNKMGENEIEPKDQLIYLAIKFFDGKGGCFPSLQKIAEKSGASIPTVRTSIKRLENKEYIKVVKKGRGQEYYFNKYKKFEPFSPEFLDKKDITFTTKAYIAASQQYMYKDVEGVGKISYPNTELSKKINMPESTIRKCNAELIKKNYLTIIKNECRDLETGCKTDTKIFNLSELEQAIIWTLKNHEDRIEKNTQDISDIKKQLEEQSKLINKLLEENTKLKNIEKENYTC